MRASRKAYGSNSFFESYIKILYHQQKTYFFVCILFRLWTLGFTYILLKQDFYVIKCQKLASGARATSHLVLQKLLGTIVIVRSVFTTRS